MDRRTPNQAVAEAARRLARASDEVRQAALGTVAEYEAASRQREVARRALAKAVALVKSED